MKNKSIKIFFVLLVSIFIIGCNENNKNIKDTMNKIEDANTGYIKDKIEINKIDNSNYEFTYNGVVYNVLYVTDTWKIYNSYMITNSHDIKKICKALIDIHPIHGSDMNSYRTEEDMAYEWLQHNMAYKLLPEGNSFRNSAKDVDLDPKDQGKSLVEIYEDRTGKKLDISSFLDK